jgi:Ran GTPase-activating protein (RanGAP) involved in mRNA processing and transport
LQNGNVFVDYLKDIFNSKNYISLILKKTKSMDSSAEEDNEEEKESKESKENENTEKEKEFKNIKYLHEFVYLSIAEVIIPTYGIEEAELFSRDFQIETPPPRITIL